MGTPGTINSPWVWQALDYQNNAITITINFNNSTRALTGGKVVRDAGCVYGTVYIGQGADGTPNTAPDKFAVPTGTTNLTANQLKRNGLATIENVLALQITAGP
jgi:hypothetical protein